MSSAFEKRSSPRDFLRPAGGGCAPAAGRESPRKPIGSDGFCGDLSAPTSAASRLPALPPLLASAMAAGCRGGDCGAAGDTSSRFFAWKVSFRVRLRCSRLSCLADGSSRAGGTSAGRVGCC
jgi:hypothetical protein